MIPKTSGSFGAFVPVTARDRDVVQRRDREYRPVSVLEIRSGYTAVFYNDETGPENGSLDRERRRRLRGTQRFVRVKALMVAFAAGRLHARDPPTARLFTMRCLVENPFAAPLPSTCG